MPSSASAEPATAHASADALDLRAKAALRRASGISFGFAQDSTDLEAVYRLRWITAARQGWLQYPGSARELLQDEYDTHALQLAAWQAGRVVGTCRLVLPAPLLLLPTEAAFELSPGAASDAVDCGRLCVAADAQTVSHSIWHGLLGFCWLAVRDRGYQRLLGSLTPRMAAIYGRMGLLVHPLAEPRPLWGEWRYPAAIGPV